MVEQTLDTSLDRESQQTSKATTEDKSKQYDVIKSENDNMEYKYLELENQIKILLISDETTEKAAASVDVNIGYFVDPIDVPGIAHFCEHMLFLGTKKYPVENDFTQFLSQNGGRSNAYTSEEHTNYHFDVKHDALQGAIDRFAQFFLGPLFNQDATDRELNAIESEFQKNVLDDFRRYWAVQTKTSRPDHVFKKFGTGNLNTLKTIPTEKNIDIRDLLLKFHDKYYSSNIMTVAVLGKESLVELENMVVPLFKDVLQKNVCVPYYEEHPFGKNELLKSFKIATVKELKTLKLSFPFPDLQKYYKKKPAHYLSHLIGHEGKGSLLSMLKKHPFKPLMPAQAFFNIICDDPREKDWVNELGAGGYQGANGYGFFNIGMELSEEGLAHIEDIITIVFQYIKMLQKEGPNQELFMEMKMLDEMKFRFKDKRLPSSYVTQLSQSMHEKGTSQDVDVKNQIFPAEDILYGSYRVDSFDPDLITDLLGYLRPDNFRYYVLAQHFKDEVDLTVEHYNAKYSVSDIPLEKTKTWENVELHEEFFLPKINPFIPDSLEIKVPKVKSKEKAVPTIIKDSNMMRTWYKADDTFYLPKSQLHLSIACPLAHSSPFHSNQLSIFVSLLKDELTEYSYDAEIAGINYNINPSSTGLLMKVSGYNDKQLVLLMELLHQMIKLEIKTERFGIIKKKLEESIRNTEANQPYTQIGNITHCIMHDFGWTPEELLAGLEGITVDTLKLYLSQLFKYIYVECLVAGNLLLDEAKEISDTVEKILINDCHSLPMLPVQHILSREYRLPDGCSYLFEKRNKIHDLSCVQIYLQIGLQEMRKNVLLELFSQMLKEDCFDTLRTKEQLGYIVFSGITRSVSVQGLKILIQSDKSPSEVEHRIDTFLSSFRSILVEMSDKQFQDYVSGLETKKIEKPKRLGVETAKYWTEILIKQYHFRRNLFDICDVLQEKGDIEVEELHKLCKQDILEFYDKYISPTSKVRRKLASVILGKEVQSLMEDLSDEKKTWNMIDDVLKFKSSLSLYPFILPFNDVPLLATAKSKL